RKRRKARKVSCGNDGPWKAWKTQERFPTLPTALGNPAKAAGFPHSHSYGGGPYSYGKAKQKPSPTYNVPRWAKLNRRKGPKEVAKRMRLRCGLMLCSCHKRFTVLLLTPCASAMSRQLQWLMPAGLLCKVASRIAAHVA